MGNFPEYQDITTVACIGAGTIGGGWAAYFLSRGLSVRVWDPSPDAGQKLRRLIDAAWPALTELGLSDGASPDDFTVHTDLAEALRGAGFIQESAPEVLELKQDLLARLAGATGPDVVIGSSTSGYAMSDMATTAVDASRLVVGHPFNPPYLIPLVEVVGGEATEPDATAWAAGWYEYIGKSVISMDREIPGFIANRLQEALWREALHMVDNGEATVEQIDLAITEGPGLRWPVQGPMLTFHLAGGEGGMAHMLDHFGPSLKSPWTRLTAPELTPELRQRVIDGCDDEADGRLFSELIAERDAGIIAIRRALAPSMSPVAVPGT
ncbi:3-hydroxyacyl-CoA dehydrogenase NAD-binding domain-containing protein [Paeniglutamicibacter cryotolerans]|uniref:Carnitine 3-dehydrogenase n=1 Tax=Paeniglutamicibacter cryotolerans TaxID=670079 RepID=A0A839QKU6_9MICC|nr:3-hydroxyacyl-CoA dehydrogenase NAD-binding domain-containing protein [Paeniglutamicibacter cryotolerans]MBB2997028.1 carnitine 3-dehydrogenase [Paeniglutamicibacter cryotolerans]